MRLEWTRETVHDLGHNEAGYLGLIVAFANEASP